MINLRGSLQSFSTGFNKFPWSLGLALGMILFFIPHPEWHGDLQAFRVGMEELRHPYYARWIFWLLQQPSEPVAFVMLSLTCTVLLYSAVRIWGGRHWMVFGSFAYAWTLIYGQIDGLVVGALALAWWAIQENKPFLAGLGIAIASIKPQLAAPMILAIWWWSPSRIKTLAVPLVVVGLSFVVWGWWIPEWAGQLFETRDLVYLSRNISLWPESRGWILLTWLPILAIPLSRERKMLAIVAGTALTSPYFPLPSAVLFLSMPFPGWVYLIAQIPILSAWVGYWLYWGMKALPIFMLAWAIWPSVKGLYHSFYEKFAWSG